jgi:hypothetical protein
MMTRSSLMASHTRLAGLSLLLLGALSGCVGAAREPLDSLSELNSSETIVVGRIELVPALAQGEQKVQGLNSGTFENKIFILADEQSRDLKKEPVIADYTGRIEATIGKNFFVRSNNKSFFIRGGMMYLEVGGREMNRAYFPGGLKASIKPRDKAIYIGTVQYHRNEFFDISKVVVVDDYDRANTEFKEKFGTKYSLRKALLTPAN